MPIIINYIAISYTSTYMAIAISVSGSYCIGYISDYMAIAVSYS